MTKRFADVTGEDMATLLTNKTSKLTDNNTKMATKTFQDYCKIENIDYISKTKEELNNILSKFYMSVRKANGDKYRFQSLQQLRYSLNRFFKDTINIDIIHDTEFKTSGNIFNCLSKTLKKEGLGLTRHYPMIDPNDFNLIFNKLSANTPTQLQYQCWILIMLYFARRGGENLETMKKDSIEIVNAADGRRYVKAGKDEATKNHQTSSRTDESLGGRIYSTGNKDCPVETIEKYISKLSKNHDYLWQRPKDSFYTEDDCWFQNRHHGHCSIVKFMKHISKLCGTSIIYTNHCLRVSTCNILDDAGYKDKDIMSISGHRSIASLDIYKKTKESRKSEMSDKISESIGIYSKEICTTTATKMIKSNNSFKEDEIEGDLIRSCEEIEMQYHAGAMPASAPILKNCSNCTIHINYNYK